MFSFFRLPVTGTVLDTCRTQANTGTLTRPDVTLRTFVPQKSISHFFPTSCWMLEIDLTDRGTPELRDNS